ncbi:MAG: hypothetical protein HY819_15160 [Acidobacteria bacterium]|nr:hypothetical protein [Acidobacteriota bacterium]
MIIDTMDNIMTESVLDQMVEDLGKFIPKESEKSEKYSRVELMETFPLWKIYIDKISDSDSIDNLAKDFGEWHHQIFLDSTPKAFARSFFRPRDKFITIIEFAFSPLAKELNSLIEMINHSKYESLEGKVRLLRVSALSVYAFWLKGTENTFIIADFPKCNQGNDFLPTRRFLSEAEFMRVLSKQMVISGVI